MAVKLKSLDPETLKEPLSRIGSASQASQFVQSLISEEDERSDRRTQMQGMFDGNQPWSPTLLREKGQGHRTNFNLRESEGAIDSAKTPYYDLAFEVPRSANVTMYVEEAEAQLLFEWSEGMSDEYHEVLDRWDGYDQVMQLQQWEMVTFGIGPTFWPHPLDWRDEAIKIGRVLVPMRTRASVDKLEVFVILHRFRVDQLWKFIKNESSAKSEGWNPKLVKKEIAKAGKEGTVSGGHGARGERYQQALRHGDLFYAITQSEDVRVASIFVREFSGKFSHFMIGRSPASDKKEESEDNDKEEGYLYKKKEWFDSASQIINPFFFDTGPDGEWHSIKGLGPKIYDFCDISNRMTCQMIDGAVVGSGLTVEASDANSLQETQISLLGGVTVVGPGRKVVQTRIAEALNGAITIKRDLQGTLQSNTGGYRQRVSGEQDEPTLGQAQLNAQQQALLSKGSVNRYYNSLDRSHRERLRRLLDPRLNGKKPGAEEAEYFRECCEKRGIPKEYISFDYVQRVKAVRSLGYGSPQIRDIATKELVSMIPMMDEVSRNNALRARAAAIPGVGQAMVDLYFPSIKKKKLPDDHVWEARIENNHLREMNGEVVVTPNQNHPTHFNEHFTDSVHHLKQLQAGQAKPHEVLIHLEEAGPHMKNHLDRMAGDPTRNDEHKKMTKAWEGLSKMSDELHHAIEQDNATQEKNAPPPAPDPAKMADLLKAHGDLQLKAEKQKGDFQLKVVKEKNRQKLADLKQAAEMKRASREVSRV